MNKEPKTWVVFSTKMGYVVSRYKMTITEADDLCLGSSTVHDYIKELGIRSAEHFISEMYWNPLWTQKEAQRYCDKENKKRFNILNSLLDEESSEVD